jgi:lysyl-tRNA synthetase, class II
MEEEQRKGRPEEKSAKEHPQANREKERSNTAQKSSESEPTAQHPLIQERLKKAEELRTASIEPYPYSFERTHKTADILQQHQHLAAEQHSGESVSIAGRVILLRKMGKVCFGHLQDGSGRIQFYAKEDELGEKYLIIRKLDLGDFLGVQGEVVATKTGEITVHAKTLEFLAKAIRPPPEKHHGLQDMELRYRKRYLDLIANPDVKERFVQRSLIIKALREYLDKHGLLEVETPTLQPVYGGANAKPFTTHHNALNMQLFLRISDELYLKRLIIGGFDGVYEICKDFRNEGVDVRHNPEFTMLEWYVAYGDYKSGMQMTERLVAQAAKAARGQTTFSYQGKELDLTPPWRRAKMTELIKEHAKLDVKKMEEDELKAFCTEHKVEFEEYDTWGLLVQHIFEHFCEEHLWQPTFVIDHPVETTPLCKTHRSGDARFVERFELYIAGMELANAYSELNDPVVQRRHLEAQAERRKHGDEEAQPMDDDFVEAMEYGMPPTSGVGLGVDRLVMILTDSASIRDVIFFPAMKPTEPTRKE